MRAIVGCLFAALVLLGCDSADSTPGTNDVSDVLNPDTSGSDAAVEVAPDTVDLETSPDVAPDTTTTDVEADTTVPETIADTTEPTPDVVPDTTTPETTPDTTSAGACDNTADNTTLAGLAATLEAKIQTCAFECLGQGAACATTCIQRETALSSGCSTCFGEVIACTISNCALQCLDASSAGCTTCRDTNCTPAFETCAGIVQP
jgi:hypothetical protein